MQSFFLMQARRASHLTVPPHPNPPTPKKGEKSKSICATLISYICTDIIISALLKSESASTRLCYTLFALGLFNRQEACFSWPPTNLIRSWKKKKSTFLDHTLSGMTMLSFSGRGCWWRIQFPKLSRAF